MNCTCKDSIVMSTQSTISKVFALNTSHPNICELHVHSERLIGREKRATAKSDSKTFSEIANEL